MEGLNEDKEVESVMMTTTPPSRDVTSRKRKREVEGLGSPSADAVSEKNLRETAPIVLARWKTAAYKSNPEPRKLLEVEKEWKFSPTRQLKKTSGPRGRILKEVRRAGRPGKWMLARSGSQMNIRSLGSK